MTTYEYIIGDFVCLQCVLESIASSEMTDKEVDHCNQEKSNNAVYVYFTNELSVADKALLDAIMDTIPLQTWKKYRSHQVDELTDQFIAEGFEYNNITFELDLEHQMDYKADYDTPESVLTYPRTLKGIGNNFITFQDRSEHTTFYYTGMGYVRTMIGDGWKLKYLGGQISTGQTVTPITTLTLQQLKDWTDPRLS